MSRNEVLGYINPTGVFPQVMTLVVREAEAFLLVYPDGTKEPIESFESFETWASINGVRLAGKETRLYIEDHELVLALSDDDLIAGSPFEVARQIELRLAFWSGPAVHGMQLA